MNEKRMTIQRLSTDFLIIGGGTAGCGAALSLCRFSGGNALIIEKANIERSGCLAAGVNALNAYILPGRTPEDYADYVRRDAEGIVREDLVLTMAEGLNRAAARLEELGLTILRDASGNYAARGDRNIKINGENIKPVLAGAVRHEPRIAVLERVGVIGYIVRGGRISGVYGIGADEPVLYAVRAKAVLCATGGASGLYRPNNPGFSRHKMWYPPFNTGAGYAMGIRAGAEMTTFEMRFIALRCKATIAPTGTLAQGVGAKQVNALGDAYEQKYGVTTSQRVYGAVRENAEGRGPCCLRTAGITPDQDEELYRAYLNMSPSQTLKWIESGLAPSAQDVEIEGTEPYIVGGHTASGYWVDTGRETTIRGLFAAGDASGGCPQKYVTGALAEGEIAAESALKYMNGPLQELNEAETDALRHELEEILNGEPASDTADSLEAEMQAAMDQYAGGIGAGYAFSEASLAVAAREIGDIESRGGKLAAKDMRELIYIFELRDRLTVCKSVIAHLAARRETRWHCFAENLDHPEKSGQWLKFVNSRLEDGKIRIIFRDLVKRGDRYEHRDPD